MAQNTDQTLMRIRQRRISPIGQFIGRSFEESVGYWADDPIYPRRVSRDAEGRFKGMNMPKVAVVGGSIGGLTAGALLRDLGCDVDVYERSREPLVGLGTGIVVQPELVRYLLERANLDLDDISVL